MPAHWIQEKRSILMWISMCVTINIYATTSGNDDVQWKKRFLDMDEEEKETHKETDIQVCISQSWPWLGSNFHIWVWPYIVSKLQPIRWNNQVMLCPLRSCQIRLEVKQKHLVLWEKHSVNLCNRWIIFYYITLLFGLFHIKRFWFLSRLLHFPRAAPLFWSLADRGTPFILLHVCCPC